MKILGFIPARSGSKGISNKNIHLLCGQPLIYYTIQAALYSNINRCLVSTDSKEIAEISRNLGADVPFLRPTKLASDTAIIEDALEHALTHLWEQENYRPDLIVLLHPTTPLRTSNDIDRGIALLNSKNVDSVVSVSEPKEHPADMLRWNEKEHTVDFLLDNITPGMQQRQSYPKYHFLNGCVYVFTYTSFQENKSRFGKQILIYDIPQIRSIDIDTMDDLLMAEALVNSKVVKEKIKK